MVIGNTQYVFFFFFQKALQAMHVSKVFIERILVISKMAYCLQVLCSVLKAQSQRYKLRRRLKLIQEVLVLRLKHRHQKYVSLPTLRHAVTEKSGTRF